MTRQPSRSERGAALVVGLIMLVLITVMLIAALNLGTANFRSVSNMQFREEAIAASNRAIEVVIGVGFHEPAHCAGLSTWIPTTTAPIDYVVNIAVPVCVQATVAEEFAPSEEELGPSLSAASTWNTVWDIEAIGGPGRQCRWCGGGRARRCAETAHADPAGYRVSMMKHESTRSTNMKRFLTAMLAAAVVLVAHAPSRAEDIDLFVQPPGVAAGLPNVLIVLDNTANWNQAVHQRDRGAGLHGQRPAHRNAAARRSSASA